MRELMSPDRTGTFHDGESANARIATFDFPAPGTPQWEKSKHYRDKRLNK